MLLDMKKQGFLQYLGSALGQGDLQPAAVHRSLVHTETVAADDRVIDRVGQRVGQRDVKQGTHQWTKKTQASCHEMTTALLPAHAR
jgi:hypothetical protein